MAEAIVRARHPEWRAYSAGARPAGYVDTRAVQVLAEIGIAHSGASKGIPALEQQDFDVVVTVCNSAAEECPVWPGKAGRRLRHDFVDPAASEGTPDEQLRVFRRVRDELVERIPSFLNN
jgi:arsenate reductase